MSQGDRVELADELDHRPAWAHIRLWGTSGCWQAAAELRLDTLGYTPGMRSALAEALRHEQHQRFARMTPAERIAMTAQLAEEGLAMLMAAQRIDRATAMRMVRRSRQVGRKPSRCGDEAR